MDREARTCFLERETVGLTEPFRGHVTRAEVLSLARADHLEEDLLGSLKVSPPILGEGGRPICPVPLPLPAANGVIALAIDSSEQGLPAPGHMLLRDAFRTVRAALRESQDRSMRRMKEERDGND